MRQQQSLAVLLVFKLLLLGASSSAYAYHSEQNCIDAQRVVAVTRLTAKLIRHDYYQAFVESKPDTDPFVIHQYLSNPSGEVEGEGVAKTISCKMKTAERINDDFSVAGRELPAQGDLDCSAVHHEWLGQLDERMEDVVVDDDEWTFMGPMWLEPWLFEPAYRGKDGKIHLRSKSLHVPFAWWVPMPDRFKGTSYCHLIAPGYLRALSRGELSVDE